MNTGRGGLHQNAPARFVRAATQIEIRDAGGEHFIEAAEPVEIRARHEHERARYRGDLDRAILFSIGAPRALWPMRADTARHGQR